MLALVLLFLLTACGSGEAAPTGTPEVLPTAMMAPRPAGTAEPADPLVTVAPDPTGGPAITPATMQRIVLTEPEPGATIGEFVQLRGTTATIPFARNLTYRVYDAAETLVAAGEIQVLGAEGGAGSFIAPVRIAGAIGGPGRIEVLDLSPADGSVIARATVPVEIIRQASFRLPQANKP
jgi:hypothetical protein